MAHRRSRRPGYDISTQDQRWRRALHATPGTDRFIESDRVPSDATVVGTTWKFVNKNGGPDGRFKNNRQLPVMQYGKVALSTATGMNTALSFSSYEAAATLAVSISRMTTPGTILPHEPV